MQLTRHFSLCAITAIALAGGVTSAFAGKGAATITLLQNAPINANVVPTQAVNVSAFDQVTMLGVSKGSGTVVVQCYFVDQPTSDPRNSAGALAFVGGMFPGTDLGGGLLIHMDNKGNGDAENIAIPVTAQFLQCLANNVEGLSSTTTLKVVGR